MRLHMPIREDSSTMACCRPKTPLGSRNLSTTFRMTIGMVQPDGGKVIFEGREVTDMPMFQRARHGMGYLSQEPSVFQRLTVQQNLLAILETMSLTRRDRRRRANELIDQFGLGKVKKQHARLLSGGERRKLEIARALVTNPSLILLDEPFSGVDPIAVEDLQHEIRQLQEKSISILITDHNVERTLEVVDQATTLNKKRTLHLKKSTIIYLTNR